MPAPRHEQLARSARFIFHGTVQSASTKQIPGVPGTKALTVRVDEIVQGPEQLSTYEGRDVFVVPRKGDRFGNGERAVFYTNGIAFGDTLILESIGHLPLRMSGSSLRGAPRPAAVLKKRDVQERLESADMVVVGRVAAVRLPSTDATPRTGARRAASRAAPTRGPISEHDPQWREAVIEVERVEKGARARREVIVRFPASDDVRWFRSPKFAPGDEGVFILRRPDEGPPSTTGRARRAVAAGGGEVYTALDPEDVQPAELQEEIGTLARSVPAATRPRAKRLRPAPARKTSAGRGSRRRRPR